MNRRMVCRERTWINIFIFYSIVFNLLLSFCNENDCGPPIAMPNYLCLDGITIAGPGECISDSNGECHWEIVVCSPVQGYLRAVDMSFCMDNCSQYKIELEVDGEFEEIPIVISNQNINIEPYINRYVEVSLGQEVSCVECSAFEVNSLSLSDDCEYPNECFIDPCLESNECENISSVVCIPNYCGGCFADYYDNNGELIFCGSSQCDPDLVCGSAETCCEGFLYPTSCCDNNCDEPIGACDEGVTECENISGIFFGWCDMYLGVGYNDGECQYVSGCDWVVDGIDYSFAFFDSIDECESMCLQDDSLSCEDINNLYDSYHDLEYKECEYDSDCISVWGHCDIGLGGCHYSVNEEAYLQEEIEGLANLWLEGNCVMGVCDCMELPYSDCIDGLCSIEYCMEENPAGCFDTGCPSGFVCIDLEDECTPSSCYCDGFYGNWYCTEDCGGGTCIESFSYGDLNSDQIINIIDVVMMVNAILNDDFILAGDMNQDSILDVIDVVILLNTILNL